MVKNGQSLSVRIDGKLGLLIDVFRPQWTLRRSGPIVMSRRFLGWDRTEGRDPPSPKQPLAQTGMMTMISTLHTLCPGLLTGNELNRIRSRAPIGGPYWIEIIASYVVQGSNSNLRSSVSQWGGLFCKNVFNVVLLRRREGAVEERTSRVRVTCTTNIKRQ